MAPWNTHFDTGTRVSGQSRNRSRSRPQRDHPTTLHALDALTERAVWQLVREYAAHGSEAMPRESELEQIQFLLGHESILTTERHLGSEQDLKNAVNDALVFE